MIFPKTSRSASAYWSRRRKPRDSSRVEDREAPGSRLHAPRENRPPERRRLVDGGLHAREHLLVDARHRGEAMRLHLAEILRELVDRLGIRDGRGAGEIEVVDHSLEHVGEREERKGHRVALDIEERRARRDVRHEILVRENGALGLSRGAGRVDHRREVAREDGRRALFEGARVGAQRRETLLDDGLERRRLSRSSTARCR